jgi:hypothetical protein
MEEEIKQSSSQKAPVKQLSKNQVIKKLLAKVEDNGPEPKEVRPKRKLSTEMTGIIGNLNPNYDKAHMEE